MKTIQIYGERCSGTNYLEELCKANFPNVEVTNSKYGFKHWLIDHPANCHFESNDDTIYIVIFRNPYDWIRSFWKTPHHAQLHYPLTFNQFIRKEWHSFDNPNYEIRQNIKELYFERDYDMTPFRNILKLRNAKNRSFLSLTEKVQNHYFIPYELLKSQTKAVLLDISKHFNLELTNEFHQINHYVGKAKDRRINKPLGNISIVDLEFIDNELDWTIENRLGYFSIKK